MRLYLRLALGLVLSVVSAHSALAQLLIPQGRLTLQSNTPVMTSDAPNATTIYYTPYTGNQAIYYISSGNLSENTFSQLSLNLSSSAHLAGEIYDLFLIYPGGTSNPLVLCSGPAWTNSTTRSVALTQFQGKWVNSSYMLCYSQLGNYGTPTDWGVYVGSFYATANGETAMMFKPTPAAGGTSNVLGVYNAYNRVPVWSLESDSTTSFTYNSSSWGLLDGNANNSVTYLDGLGQSAVSGRVTTIAYNAVAGNGDFIGIDEDPTTPYAAPTVFASNQSTSTNSPVGATSFAAEENFLPQVGIHVLQAMQWSPNSTNSTFGFNSRSTFLLYKGEY